MESDVDIIVAIDPAPILCGGIGRGTSLPMTPVLSLGIGRGFPVTKVAGSLMWELQQWLAGCISSLVTSIVADLSASRSTFGAHVNLTTFAVRLREFGALRVLLVKLVKSDEKYGGVGGAS